LDFFVANTFVIVDKLKDWKSFFPAEKLLTSHEYLSLWDDPKMEGQDKSKIKVINLCRSYKYLSTGYYTSLLAEARGHTVIPSVKTINDLSRSFLYLLQSEDIDHSLQKIFKVKETSKEHSFNIYFGKADHPEYTELAKYIFEKLSIPILSVTVEFDKVWKILSVKSPAFNSLSPTDEDNFASSLDEYSSKIWRKPKSKKKYRYDLAILHNPDDKMPPSDKKALQNFIKAGKECDVLVELIEKKDFSRIAEFDALFIRETTSISNHTFKFAKKAESEGVICLDDSMSILRCTNKIYMHNVMERNNIPSPKTFVVSSLQKELLKEIPEKLGFPFIIKIPDGSFSKGVFKVKTQEDYEKYQEEIFKKTALILIQEYFYTDFDWRIGVLNGKALFACKYYMTKGHWQIYNHEHKNKRGYDVGRFESLPISKVPKYVISTALKMAHQVGDSLYGVDIKEKDGKAYVIEINDNPNIDSDVEDLILGDDLYIKIIQDFVNRIEAN
jgi:glutathione synthase/RimK-type ligase-like ATP-grasp enzyme